MDRVAVFVDAGYLFAQGSACIKGQKARREEVVFDHEVFTKIVHSICNITSPNLQLLRIYWYDGALHGPTAQHLALAHLQNVKLRLGFINSQGQQKGVDSLIITDLVDLARNRAISDAVLLGGDEDLRIGVQIAQSYGIRVHLVGIEPCRGSQSLQLMQEADTTYEVVRDEVAKFLGIRAPPAVKAVVGDERAKINETQDTLVVATSGMAVQRFPQQIITEFVDRTVQALSTDDVKTLKAAISTSPSIPRDFDRVWLGTCRSVIGRDLVDDERRVMRQVFIERLGR